MTITISWWAIPLIITIISFIVAWRLKPKNVGGDYSFIGDGIAFLFFYGIATVVSLVSWLIWAIIN